MRQVRPVQREQREQREQRVQVRLVLRASARLVQQDLRAQLVLVQLELRVRLGRQGRRVPLDFPVRPVRLDRQVLREPRDLGHKDRQGRPDLRVPTAQLEQTVRPVVRVPLVLTAQRVI